MKSSKSSHEHTIIGMVSVNDKGQIVIPAEARATMGIESGDRLIVIAHPNKEGLMLMKPDSLESVAKSMLSKLNSAKEAYSE